MSNEVRAQCRAILDYYGPNGARWRVGDELGRGGLSWVITTLFNGYDDPHKIKMALSRAATLMGFDRGVFGFPYDNCAVRGWENTKQMIQVAFARET